jgi:two-component system, chemotaxis family, protein-glutamate methylesterase/glutaminase
MSASFDHVIVIGASAGGVHALLQITETLPGAFPAPICIVQHIGSNPSLLPELLRFRGNNHAVHPEDGQPLAAGTLYLAPPDRHLLLEGDKVRLTHGPRENHARPAIDPLFRSAALAFGTRVIGVVLTGQMDDGSAGLKAIKECGGVAIVQDPASAAEPEMPRSALASVDVDHCVPLEEIGPLLTRLVGNPAPKAPPEPSAALVHEVAINRGNATVEMLEGIATPSPLTCPECGGGLWEMKETKPLRYRCHTGHAYGALTLGHSQKESTEQSLWATVRGLREREMLLRRMASIAEATGDLAQAQAGRAQAERLEGQIRVLQAGAEEEVAVGETNTTA